MKVLIIDDEPPIVAMYQEKLEHEGFTVISATGGEAGIERAKKDKPDVILLDLIMPKLNGLDVLKNLKGDPITQPIPVFLLTNIPEESGGDKGDKLGAAGYLFKAETEPHQLAEVLKKLEKTSPNTSTSTSQDQKPTEPPAN